jgi:hypothetical protein
MSITDPLATLGTALTAIQTVRPNDITEGTLTDLGERLMTLYTIQAETRSLIEELTESIGLTMESDTMSIDGVGKVVRKPRFSSTWIDDASRERMMEDATRAIIKKLAVDRVTGEIHSGLAQTIRETVSFIESSFSIGADPKTGFRKQLGLATDEYRAKRQTGFSLAIEEVPS